jgi:hypothetical protein
VILMRCWGCRWRSRRQCLRRWAGMGLVGLRMVFLLGKCVILIKKWVFFTIEMCFIEMCVFFEMGGMCDFELVSGLPMAIAPPMFA